MELEIELPIPFQIIAKLIRGMDVMELGADNIHYETIGNASGWGGNE